MNLDLKTFIPLNTAYLVLTLLLTLSSCSVQRSYEPAELTVNGRQRNKLIIDRYPEYGIDSPNGCIVKGQFSMEITELEDSHIRGKVYDSSTKEIVPYSHVILIQENNTDTIYIGFDNDGWFNHSLKSPLNRIEVTEMGYHTLIVDISKLR